ncbi:MAG: cytochrome c-type biogenesis CcmF C-terminal domain-containing protein [Escherichia coli]
MGLGSISIGEPFFNTVHRPDGAVCAAGLGPLIRWRRDDVASRLSA